LFLFIVHQSVVENNIPVVFLQGSGESCDLFAKIYYLYNEYHQNFRKSYEKKKFVFCETHIFYKVK